MYQSPRWLIEKIVPPHTLNLLVKMTPWIGLILTLVLIKRIGPDPSLTLKWIWWISNSKIIKISYVHVCKSMACFLPMRSPNDASSIIILWACTVWTKEEFYVSIAYMESIGIGPIRLCLSRTRWIRCTRTTENWGWSSNNN